MKKAFGITITVLVLAIAMIVGVSASSTGIEAGTIGSTNCAITLDGEMDSPYYGSFNINTSESNGFYLKNYSMVLSEDRNTLYVNFGLTLSSVVQSIKDNEDGLNTVSVSQDDCVMFSIDPTNGGSEFFTAKLTRGGVLSGTWMGQAFSGTNAHVSGAVFNAAYDKRNGDNDIIDTTSFEFAVDVSSFNFANNSKIGFTFGCSDFTDHPGGVTWTYENNSLTNPSNWKYVRVRGLYSYALNTDGTITLAQYCGAGDANGAYAVPSTLDGYPVKAIGDSCYAYNKALVSVTVPAGIESVGERAFAFCEGLKTITYPDSVVAFGEAVHYHDLLLESCTLPDSTEVIPIMMFRHCMKLKNFTWPASLKVISENAFYNTVMPSLNIPEGVTTIGPGAFYNPSLATSITIPSTCTSIGADAFCNAVAAKCFWNSTDCTIDDSAFRACYKTKFYAEPNTPAADFIELYIAARRTDGSDWATYDPRYGMAFICTDGHHILSDWAITKEPTAIKSGKKEAVCYYCATVITETIPKGTAVPSVVLSNGNNLPYKSVSPSWWTNNGTDGNDLFQYLEDIVAFADNHTLSYTHPWTRCQHNWGAFIVDVEPTCLVAGSKHRVCANTYCKEEEVVSIPPLGHDFSGTPDVIVEPTCTEPGYSTVKCSRCDVVGNRVDIPKNGHSFGEWIIDTEATETETGSKHRICSVCDFREDVIIPILGHEHTPGTATVETEPTCTLPGNRVIRCTECNEIISEEAIPPLGHTPSDWIVDTPATFDAAGTRHKECTVCGTELERESIAQLVWKNPFKDVKENTWYFEAVRYVNYNGLIKGTNDGSTFEPDTVTTRAMFVNILYRLEEHTETYQNRFTDVPDGAWYEAGISWAASEGVVSGTSATTFSPNSNLDRQQMATMLYNYANYKEMDMTATGDYTEFKDAAAVDGWATTSINWALGKSLISGTSQTEKILNPKGQATRATIAVIMMKFMQNIIGD